MIRFRLKELIAEKEFKEDRRITLNEIADETGIHRVTLSRIANAKGYNAGIDNVDRLCAFFDVQPGALMEFVKGEVSKRSTREPKDAKRSKSDAAKR